MREVTGKRATMQALTGALVTGALLAAAPAGADRDAWMNTPAATEGSAEARVNEGIQLSDKKDWTGAEAAFRDAIRMSPTIPQAWNGLGYALRHQKRYDESIQSYGEALRLKPDYPQALEYLGEAFLEMGRTADARQILERLRPLDPDEADELEAAIAKLDRR